MVDPQSLIIDIEMDKMKITTLEEMQKFVNDCQNGTYVDPTDESSGSENSDSESSDSESSDSETSDSDTSDSEIYLITDQRKLNI